METIWIIGAGRFGTAALEGLSRAGRPRRFVVVDPAGGRLRAAAGPGRTPVQAEGVDYLARNLTPTGGPDWIVPAVPLHLAAEWCLRTRAGRLRRMALPPAFDARVPHPLRGEGGDLYASHADFVCPEGCAEPPLRCTATGKPRPPNLFDLLAKVRLPDLRCLVVRSHQLGPGIGGYRPAQLFALLARLDEAGGRAAIATSCRCHAVITAVAPEVSGEGA